MLKTLSLSTIAALAMVSITSAQIVAPREAHQKKATHPNSEQHVQGRDGTVIINQDGQRVRVEGTAEGTASAQTRGDLAQRLNGQLADCLLLKNQEEINLARFALEHSQNDKVRAFAQRLIDDHQKYAESLQRFALHSNSATPTGRTTEDQPSTTFQRQPSQPQAATPAQSPVILPADSTVRPVVENRTRPGERIDVKVGYTGNQNSLEETWYQIERKAVQNCEQMTREMLGKEKGADFDHCFVGVQIGAHTALLAQMKAAESHVTGEFQQVLREGIQTVQQHKQHAEELKAELAQNQAASSNQR